MNSERNWNFQLATCGEQIDIDRYGIAHNRCIDGDLITRLAWDDKVLMDFMKVKIQQMPAPSLFEDSPSLPDGANYSATQSILPKCSQERSRTKSPVWMYGS